MIDIRKVKGEFTMDMNVVMYEYMKHALKKRRLSERQLAFVMDRPVQYVNRNLNCDMRLSFIV